MKVGDGDFSTLLLHFFYFFVEDEERAAVNYESKLGKEALGEVRVEGGGGVG